MIEHLLTPLVSEKFINDERYRNGHLRVINALPETRILGVHIPELKMLAKSIAKQDDAFELIGRFEQEFLNGDLCLEEKLVWGLLINAVKLPESEKLVLLKAFIPAVDNWAVCDSICCNIKWIKDKYALWEFLQPYFEPDKEFDVRFAVIMAMIFFLDPDSFLLVQLKLESLDFDRIHSEYLSPKEAKITN